MFGSFRDFQRERGRQRGRGRKVRDGIDLV